MLTRLLVVLGLALGSLSSGSLAEAPATPMRTEDVVRMLVTGASTSETVEAIRSRDVDFDLSTEMLDELRRQVRKHDNLELHTEVFNF